MEIELVFRCRQRTTTFVVTIRTGVVSVMADVARATTAAPEETVVIVSRVVVIRRKNRDGLTPLQQ